MYIRHVDRDIADVVRVHVDVASAIDPIRCPRAHAHKEPDAAQRALLYCMFYGILTS